MSRAVLMTDALARPAPRTHWVTLVCFSLIKKTLVLGPTGLSTVCPDNEKGELAFQIPHGAKKDRKTHSWLVWRSVA